MPLKSFAPSFGDHDISHIGRLFRQVRLGRGDVRQIDVALEAKTDPSTLNRFERTGHDEAPRNDGPPARRSGYFEDYVDVLRRRRINGRVIESPLKDEDAALLLGVYEKNNTPGKVRRLQNNLAAIDLDLIGRARPDNHLRPLYELDQLLHQSNRPAFVADSLWFIHALNGALLNLFALDPQRDLPYFRRWEAWHVMGSKFMDNSPIREAHCSYNDYFPPTVDQFYRAICPYLFTYQARALIRRLIETSNANGFQFGNWWHNALAFRMSFEPERLRRRIWYCDPSAPDGARVVLRTAAERIEMREVPLSADGSSTTTFWIGVWHGDEDPFTHDVLDHLRGPVDNNLVLYATDCNVQRNFHANTWPEVAPLLDP